MAGGAAVLIGALTLAEYVLGHNLGLDELFFRDTEAVATVHPGRLAPQTAIVFLCLGMALVLLSGRHAGRRVADALAGLAFVIALFAVLGYAYGAPSLNKLPSLTPMALHTAIACVVLCVGVAASQSEGFFVGALNGGRRGSVVARRLLPLVLLPLPALGWLRLQGEVAGLYSRETGVALLVLISVLGLAAALLYLARALNRIDAERERTVAAQHRVATLVEASNEAILSADRAGIITSWNAAASRLYGYAAHEIVGSPLSTLIPPDRTEERARLFGAALAGARVAGYETRRLHKNGSLLDVALTVAPIEEAGTVIGVCAISHDIGERLRARETLEATVRERTAELSRSREETLKCLALAGEYRDDDTAQHTERVGRNAALVAQQLGLPECTVALLRQAAPIRPRGRRGIPQARAPTAERRRSTRQPLYRPSPSGGRPRSGGVARHPTPAHAAASLIRATKKRGRLCPATVNAPGARSARPASVTSSHHGVREGAIRLTTGECGARAPAFEALLHPGSDSG